ncbi:MAG TPA: patatin-like phospholipase family protein [Terracidiphilus sp.]|nr:patatin-like phospholipase family protein [Terracidiphilus sp.]
MAWKSTAILLTAVILAVPAPSQVPISPANTAPANPAPLPAVAPAGRPVVGVALEGGGALGLAHIGVLQWMEENHIPIDRLAGASMGALIGGLYSSGLTPAELRALATSGAFTGVFTLQPAYTDLSYRRRQDRHEIPQGIAVGLKHGPLLRNALLTDRGVNEFLITNMPAYNSQDLDYDRMPIPFRCVATDLTSLQPITFAHGPLPQAVRASISIPGVFPPVQSANGHYLVDGGILDNLPTDVVRRDLHAEIVIAVHLQTNAIAAADTNSIVGVLNRAFTAGIEQNVVQARALADLVVSVPFDKLSGTDYAKGGQIIRAGYLAAEQNRAVLLRYAINDNDWKTYLAARQARMFPQPGALRQVTVEGGSPSADRSVLADMKPLDGQPVAPITTINALKPIQSNGGYDATYETFSPALAAGSTAARTPGASPNDAGILVRLSKDSIGPPYLVIGPELTAATSNITRMEINLRFVDQNFRGFGSELRGTAELGFKTVLTAEYYRLLTPSGFFLEPRATVSREPVFIWANQKRIAERFQQNLVAGLEVGRTFGNTMQVSAEWRAADVRWALRTGSGGGPYLTGTAQTGLLHINIDKASSGAISPSGFRLAASAGALYHAVGSRNAPMVQFSFNRTFPLKQNNIIGMSLEVDSYLRANVAQPYRFTLGGPMRLSASAIDEYRGTDLYLARSGYMHRLAALPTGLGQGLYGLISYEAGEVWSPEQRAFLRQNGTVGLVGNTPLGLVTFGVSVGDAGHRKVFITLGRWF